MQRRLSLTEGSSDKFWYIDVAGTAVTVRYGRRGSAGTTKTKEYDTAE
ncbi:WGR domain-containing protein, partial [Arachnia propionica]